MPEPKLQINKLLEADLARFCNEDQELGTLLYGLYISLIPDSKSRVLERSDITAEDVFQIGLIRILDRLRDPDFKRLPYVTISTIAKAAVLHQYELRQKRAMLRIEETIIEDENSSPDYLDNLIDNHPNNEDILEITLRFISKEMKPEYRAVFTDHFLNNQSIIQISESTGYSISTVTGILKKAIRSLRYYLLGQGYAVKLEES